MPTYTTVEELYIGIEEGAILEEYDPYLPVPPIVYYGSSITQGGCVSRPGNTYEAKITRDLGIDHINLGFSGNAKGELVMAEYLSNLDMSLLVIDYEHNAPSPEHLKATHEPFFKYIRSKRPNLPIVICSSPDIVHREDCKRFTERRQTVFTTYLNALESGDRNVYFVDGMQYFEGVDKDFCTTDGCHPTDMGHYYMALSIESAIKTALENKE